MSKTADPLDPMGFYRSGWFWGLVIGACVIMGLAVAAPRAQAQPKPGIWFEGTFTVSDELVQKFRDTTHGSNNACYLIRRIYGGQGPSNPQGEFATLTCVNEGRP